jgi:hypothetical protein
MYTIAKRVFPVLLPLAGLLALTCGDTDKSKASIVACGDCQAGTVHMDAVLASGADWVDVASPFICYHAWHDDQAPDCVVIVELIDIDQCPFEPEPGVDVVIETFTDLDDSEHERWLCPVPRLAAPLDCDAASAQYPDDTTAFGWYYCQDLEAACKYKLHVTAPAKEAVLGQLVELRCADCTQDDPAGVECLVDSAVVGRQCTPAGFGDMVSQFASGIDRAIELSPECGGAPCLGTARLNTETSDSTAIAQHSFCTCRCGDLDGNDHTTNSDLCQCPGESVCEPVCGHGAICPEALQGSFCVPICTAQPCEYPSQCTAPGSGDPWSWTCDG